MKREASSFNLNQSRAHVPAVAKSIKDMNRIQLSHPASASSFNCSTMLRSLLVLYFANIMIIPITFATPFQQFYTDSQTADIQADQAPSFLEASYDGDQAAVDSSTSKPAFLANNQFDWLKNFFVPPPPPWQGTDKDIAAQFTCEASTAYCCTGRYDAERKYALQPCFYCATYPPATSRQILNLWHR